MGTFSDHRNSANAERNRRGKKAQEATPVKRPGRLPEGAALGEDQR
jgi:hypothetical protein